MILLQGYERPTQFISNHPRVYLSFISGHLPFGTVFQRPSATNSKRQRPLLSRTVTQTIRETRLSNFCKRRSSSKSQTNRPHREGRGLHSTSEAAKDKLAGTHGSFLFGWTLACRVDASPFIPVNLTD